MTVIATKEKGVLSSVVMDDINALVHDYNYAYGQTATEASDTEYKLGQVVIWNTDHWEILKTGDVLTGASGVATAGAPIAVVVGFSALGDGLTGTVTSGGNDVVVLYQGAVNVKESGLIFDGGLSAGEVTAAKVQLAKQGLTLKAVASQVAVTEYNA